MREILPILVVGILILSGFGAIALKSDNVTANHRPIFEKGNEYSHIIIGEFGTATWCGYCKYAHAALKNIYAGGWHPFYYVTLVCDKNTHANQRAINELGLTGYPTVYFDGGYQKNVGAGSTPSAQAAYNTSIVSCGERDVDDVDIDLDVTWNGNAEMDIDVSIDNNGGSSYSGHLRVFVCEIVSSMGWIDSGGYTYTMPFLEYAFNQVVSISSGGTWSNSVTWDGHDYNDGYGSNFGGITYGNIMVIASIYDNDDDYSDDTTGYRVGDNNPPNTPSNPDPEDEETDVDVDVELNWKCSDSNHDVLSFDIYLGESSNPPLVESDHLGTSYYPENLDLETTYYWKIVARDCQGATKTGPVWEFTTRGNDPPYTPSDPDPEDGATDIYLTTDVSWTGGDPDGDDVTYDVYFGTNNPPPQVKENQSGTNYNPPGVLDFETQYYWKIVAWDEFNYTSAGSIWSFTTEENLPPYEASDPEPEDGATDVDIDEILRWTGNDPNPGDKLTYDIYFGTSSPPPLADEGLAQAAYDPPGAMDLETTYYWQIVTEDSEGLTITGPIWEFTTQLEPNDPPDEPDINGPHTGVPDKEICWTFASTDPDGDDLKYVIEWGDGETTTTDCFPSGQTVEECHTYSEEGAYFIKAKAVECPPKDLESDWSEHKVTIPRGKISIYILFQRFLQRFPIAFPMLKYLPGL